MYVWVGCALPSATREVTITGDPVKPPPRLTPWTTSQSRSGVVPLDGRGSLPFALVHGESLVAAASWALTTAGADAVRLRRSRSKRCRTTGQMLVVHDPLCPLTPTAFLEEAIAESERTGAVVVGVRPVTDTVKEYADERLGSTVDRDELMVRDLAGRAARRRGRCARRAGPRRPRRARRAAQQAVPGPSPARRPPSAGGSPRRRTSRCSGRSALPAEALAEQLLRELDVLGEGDLQVRGGAGHGVQRQRRCTAPGRLRCRCRRTPPRRPAGRRRAARGHGTPAGSVRRPGRPGPATRRAGRAAGPARSGSRRRARRPCR